MRFPRASRATFRRLARVASACRSARAADDRDLDSSISAIFRRFSTSRRRLAETLSGAWPERPRDGSAPAGSSRAARAARFEVERSRRQRSAPSASSRLCFSSAGSASIWQTRVREGRRRRARASGSACELRPRRVRRAHEELAQRVDHARARASPRASSARAGSASVEPLDLGDAVEPPGSGASSRSTRKRAVPSRSEVEAPVGEALERLDEARAADLEERRVAGHLLACSGSTVAMPIARSPRERALHHLAVARLEDVQRRAHAAERARRSRAERAAASPDARSRAQDTMSRPRAAWRRRAASARHPARADGRARARTSSAGSHRRDAELLAARFGLRYRVDRGRAPAREAPLRRLLRRRHDPHPPAPRDDAASRSSTRAS